VKKVIPAERFWRVPFDEAEIPRVRGEVRIQEERCKGCNYCVEFCPCRVFAASERFNTKGYHPPDIVAREACLGCHLCELLCPEFAIGVRELSYRRDGAAVA
jgi:2-oxoglutarate ferredoxin oxidoreductase subunit delta